MAVFIMEAFLIFTSMLLFFFGSIFLLSPERVKEISDFCNRTVFAVDEKMRAARRPVGIIFLAVTIILWYIALKE